MFQVKFPDTSGFLGVPKNRRGVEAVFSRARARVWCDTRSCQPSALEIEGYPKASKG